MKYHTVVKNYLIHVYDLLFAFNLLFEDLGHCIMGSIVRDNLVVDKMIKLNELLHTNLTRIYAIFQNNLTIL